MKYAAYKIGGVGWIACTTDTVIAVGTDESEVIEKVEGWTGQSVSRLVESPPEEFFATFQVACASQLQALEAADQFAIDEYNNQATKIAEQSAEIEALRRTVDDQFDELGSVKRYLARGERQVQLTNALMEAGGFRPGEIETIVDQQLAREGLL